jgi:hypothetical protein
MYLLENTGDVQAQYSMGPGDVLVFAKLPGGGYAICGRKGTKDDVTRKPASRRTREESAASAAEARSKRARARGSDSSKARRQRQKQAAQAVSGMFGYWAAHRWGRGRMRGSVAVGWLAAAAAGGGLCSESTLWKRLQRLPSALSWALGVGLEAVALRPHPLPPPRHF